MRLLLLEQDQTLAPLSVIRYTSGVSLFTLIRNQENPVYCYKNTLKTFEVMFPWRQIQEIPKKLVAENWTTFALFEFINSLSDFKEVIFFYNGTNN